jgi:hypothetical protein
VYLLIALDSFLSEKELIFLDALICVQSAVDFYLMTQYFLHDFITLKYLKDYLKRFYRYKFVFLKYWSTKAAKLLSDTKKKKNSLVYLSFRSSKKRRISSIESITSEVTILKQQIANIRALDYFMTIFNVLNISSEVNKSFVSEIKSNVDYQINLKIQ